MVLLLLNNMFSINTDVNVHCVPTATGYSKYAKKQKIPVIKIH